MRESGEGGGCWVEVMGAAEWECSEDKWVSGDGGEWEWAEGDVGGWGCAVSVSGEEGEGCVCAEGEEGGRGPSSCSRTQLSWTAPRTACNNLTASL